MTGSWPPPASKLSVFDSFDRLGVWSFPDHAPPMCGKMEYDPSRRVRLSVMGLANPITSLQEALGGAPRKIPAIRGVLETGEHVLLDECFMHDELVHTRQREAGTTPDGAEIQGGSTSVARSTYTARQTYVSNQPVPDSPKFSRVTVSYTSLFTWLNNYSINTALNEDRSATITFTPPKERKTAISDGLSVSILHGYSIRKGMPQKEFRLPQSAAIMFEVAHPVRIDEFYPHISTFANFLMMATRGPAQPEAFRIPYGDDTVTVFPSYKTRASLNRDDDIFRMHFNYQEIAAEFDKILESWFAISKKYSKSMDLYFQTRLDEQTTAIDIKFIRLVQGLEAFHRAKHPEKHSKGTHTSIYDAVKGLVHELPYEIFDESMPEPDFLSSVSTARNYISHGFIQDREAMMPDHRQLAVAAQRSELLLYGCYLDELDAGDKLKSGIMKKQFDYAGKFKFAW